MSIRSARKYDVQAGWSGNRQSVAVLETRALPPIPDLGPDKNVSWIRVYTDSHDQGFSSFPEFHNTRRASSSWFELALVRLVPPPAAFDRVRHAPTPLPGSLPLSASPTTTTTTTTSRDSLDSNDDNDEDDDDEDDDDDGERENPLLLARRQAARGVQTPRTDGPSLPTYETVRRIRLYSNLHANREFVRNSIRLVKTRRETNVAPDSTSRETRTGQDDNDDDDDADEERQLFLDAVRTGDKLVLYALAQYPAWSNAVRACQIDVGMRAL